MKNYPNIKVKPPGPKAQEIIAKDEAYTSTSYIKEYPLVVERGEGAMLQDVDGNRFLDFMAGIAVVTTGHSHPKVVQAIKDAADKFLHICSTDFYYPSFAALRKRWPKLHPVSRKKKFFLEIQAQRRSKQRSNYPAIIRAVLDWSRFSALFTDAPWVRWV